jgi:hypothetical protein
MTRKVPAGIAVIVLVGTLLAGVLIARKSLEVSTLNGGDGKHKPVRGSVVATR